MAFDLAPRRPVVFGEAFSDKDESFDEASGEAVWEIFFMRALFEKKCLKRNNLFKVSSMGEKRPTLAL